GALQRHQRGRIPALCDGPAHPGDRTGARRGDLAAGGWRRRATAEAHTARLRLRHTWAVILSIAVRVDRRRGHPRMPASMKPILYAHPFSSYCQKVLVALYENDTPFEYRHLEEGGHMDELAARWPMKRFPILVDGGRTVIEASTIIEHLQLHHPGP